MSHHQLEEEAGREIWPATPKHVKNSKLQEEIDFCEKLDCKCEGNAEGLEW